MKRIAIHSAPRSGSSWLGTIFDSHPEVLYKFQPLFSYELKGQLNEVSSKDEIDAFFKKLRNTSSVFLDQINEKEKNIVPTFKKQSIQALVYKEVRYHHVLRNLLQQDKMIKVIGLVRDPRAVLYSWGNTPREFDKGEGWDFNAEWKFARKKNRGKKEEFYGYEKWKELTNLFHKLEIDFPEQFKLVNYQQLIANTQVIMEGVMHFCEMELDTQQLEFIAASQSQHSFDPYSVYKKRKADNAWYDKLPNHINEFIKSDLIGTKLECYLDEF